MEQLLLLATLLCAPPIIGASLVAAFMGAGSWRGQRWKSLLSLHPAQGLVHQAPMWLSIVIPICYFLILGGFSWGGYSVSLNAEGFKRFIEISVLPLALLSVSLPLASLVSRLHATQQTAKQIEVVSTKNNFDAFYLHRKEFFSYFDQIGSLNYLGCLDAEYNVHPAVHRSFFLGTPANGAPSPKLTAFELLRGKLKFVAIMLDNVIKSDDDRLAFSYYLNACNDVLWIAERLGVREVSVKMVEVGVTFSVKFDGDEESVVATVGVTTADILASFRYLSNYFNNICSFAVVGTYKVEERHLYLVQGGRKLFESPDLVIERLHRTIIKEYLDNEALAKYLLPHS